MKIKRFLSFILSVSMLFAVAAGVDFSAVANINGDYQYSVQEDGTAIITKYTGYDFDVEIPYQLDKHVVSAIGSNAFADCNLLKTLILPGDLKQIGNSAFARCKNLINIVIRTDVREIGALAFDSCESLKSVMLPASLDVVGEFCFSGCKLLKEVMVLSSHCDIGGYAFGENKDIVVYGYANSTTQSSCEKWGYNFSAMTQHQTQIKFKDLENFAYYNDFVAYTSLKNFYIAGTNPPEFSVFSPTAPVTRAMLITILYRMANMPECNDEVNPFTDVSEGAYYYKPACWALENGITTESTFKPNVNVSREETASFLFRYANLINKINDNEYKSVNLDSYDDCGSVKEWAVESMQWANYNGMITGTQQNTLNPQGATQRVHATKILYGFGRACNIGRFE